MVIRGTLVQETWDSELGMFNHGSTFGGHPVACAVAAATIKALEDERVIENVLANESYFQEHLDAVVEKHDMVKEWRGMGYFYAVELMESRERGTELSDDDRAVLQGGKLAEFVQESGLLIRPDDRGATMFVLSPPLIADRDVLDDLFARLDQILTATEQWMETRH